MEPLREKHEVPIWNRWVTLAVVDDLGEEIRTIFDCEEDLSNKGGMHIWDEDEDFIILEAPLYRGIIAHEIWHCTYSILTNKGLGTTPECEEAYSYLDQYLTEWVYGILKLNKIKVRDFVAKKS